MKWRYTIFVGDVHGKWHALLQLLKNSGYDPKQDRLIFVGDYIDGFASEHFSAKKTIDILLDLESNNPNEVYFIRGNHDEWMHQWIQAKTQPPKKIWTRQGGRETLTSYGIPDMLPYNLVNNKLPESHILFFKTLLPSFIDESFFAIHGGFFDRDEMEIAKAGNLINNHMWDREFYDTSVPIILDLYKEIFGERIFICGHTPYGPLLTETGGVKRFLIDSGKTIDEWHGKIFAVVFDQDLQHKFVNAEQPES